MYVRIVSDLSETTSDTSLGIRYQLEQLLAKDNVEFQDLVILALPTP